MAARYWVGGTATWDGTAGSKWATSSGGAGGASVPTSSDDVFFDANSGTSGTTVSVAGGSVAKCANLDTTGFPGTITGSGGGGVLDIYAGLTLDAATLALSVNQVYFGGAGSYQVRTNGVFLAKSTGQLLFGRDSVGTQQAGTWTLQDALTCPNLILYRGTLATNGKAVSALTFNGSGSANARTLDLTGTVMTCRAAANAWIATGDITQFTLVATGSEIILSDSTATLKNFSTGSSGTPMTFNKVTLSGSGAAFRVNGANTIAELALIAGGILELTANTVTTIGSLLTMPGIAGNNVTVRSSIGGTRATLSKASGVMRYDYLTLQDIVADGGARWFAGRHSTDSGNNAGWVFADFAPRPAAYLLV